MISMNPGVNFSSIGTTLQLGNGVLDYHLHLLEKKELIKADRDGIYKRYYPHTVKVTEKKRIRLSSIQESIVEIVRGDEGISQLEISAKLELSKQLLNYHVKQLTSKGILMVTKDGNISRIMIGKEG